jgi:hypothetical protein
MIFMFPCCKKPSMIASYHEGQRVITVIFSGVFVPSAGERTIYIPLHILNPFHSWQ